jgi:hypothetical protein
MFAFLKFVRYPTRCVIIPLVAITLAACDTSGSGNVSYSGPSIDPSKPVPVALLVPRGSDQPNDEILAQNLENAARLAMRDLNGVQIDLRVYSTSGNAQTAASQATQAVNDGAKIILGPLYAEGANAAGVAVAPKNINVLAFSNNASIAGGNVFILGATFDSTAKRLVSHAVGQGRDNIVVVHAQDVAGQTGKTAIEQAIYSSGGMLAGAVDYPLSQQGVMAAVPRIKSLVDQTGANAIFMTASTATALPLLTQLLTEAGLDPAVTQYIGLTRWDIPPQTLSLPGIQGGWFALPDPTRTSAFQAQYMAAYGTVPHPLAGVAFDGIAAIGALVSSGNTNALTGAALTQGAGFQGASGVFHLLSDGTNERGLSVATVQSNQVFVISPAPFSFSGTGF